MGSCEVPSNYYEITSNDPTTRNYMCQFGDLTHKTPYTPESLRQQAIASGLRCRKTYPQRLGSPIRNAFVEIWQCDNNGAYLHAGSGNADKRDSNFQGYGRFLTDSKGNYYFRTIKPVPYPGRTPHIHIAVSLNGHRVFTSQILIKGSPRPKSQGKIGSRNSTQ